MSQRPPALRYRTEGFLLARTPLLPVDDWHAWCASAPAEASAQLHDRCSAPAVREAIHLASRSLSDALEERRKNDEDCSKLDPVLARYYARMTTRPTPYGTMAGVTFGEVGPTTRCVLGPLAEHARYVSADVDALEAWAHRVASEERDRLVWRPNPTLRRSGAGYRFLIRAPETHRWLTSERDIGRDEAVDELLARAERGLNLKRLGRGLRSVADELIDLQLLVSELFSLERVSDETPAEVLRRRLERLGLHERARALAALQSELDRERGAPPGQDRSRYDAIEAIVPWPRAEGTTSLHVDLVKRTGELAISSYLSEELCALALAMARIQPRSSVFESLREAWVARYGERAVPLLEAADNESGIVARQPTTPAFNADAARRTEFLLRKLGDLQASGEPVWDLSSDDLAQLKARDDAQLPDRIELLAVLAIPDPPSSEPIVVLYGGSGLDGSLLGRFTHLDASFARNVRHHVAAGAAGGCVAEVDMLPGARMGNTITRIQLHETRIALDAHVSGNGTPGIPLSDLLVQHDADRLRLFSKRLMKEVVPRLAHAHRFWAGNPPPAYQLLCHLSRQTHTGGFSFPWGTLARSRRLPRVMLGRHVVSVAQWAFTREELAPWTARDAAVRRHAVESLRRRYGMPRRVLVAEGDNRLPVDLESEQSLDAARTVLQASPLIVLQEAIGVAEHAFASAPEGRFTCEVVVPMRLDPPPRLPSPRSMPNIRDVPRRFAIGREFVQARFYSPPTYADRVLLKLVRHLARGHRGSGGALPWFFTRETASEHHLRVVFETRTVATRDRLLASLLRRSARMEKDGTLSRTIIDGYERLVERFGGHEALAIAERVAWRDSETALRLLSAAPLDLHRRWLAALVSLHRLLCLVTPDARLAVLEHADARLRILSRDPESLETALSRRYRALRSEVEDALGPARAPLARAVLREVARRDELLGKDAAALGHLHARGRIGATVAEAAWAMGHELIGRLARTSSPEDTLMVVDAIRRYEISRHARHQRRGLDSR